MRRVPAIWICLGLLVSGCRKPEVARESRHVVTTTDSSASSPSGSGTAAASQSTFDAQNVVNREESKRSPSTLQVPGYGTLRPPAPADSSPIKSQQTKAATQAKGSSQDLRSTTIRRLLAATSTNANAAAESDQRYDGPRDGIGYPITGDIRVWRMNLALSANPMIPRETWGNAEFRAALKISGGTFPVHLWRSRDGVITYVREMRVPQGPDATVQFSLDAAVFAKGDVAVVEWTPALLTDEIPASSGIYRSPWISMIDPRSNDPSPIYGGRMQFTGVR